MEFIIEILVELILEGCFELSKTKKTPKYLRYPIIIFIFILYIGVIGIIFTTSYLAIKENLFLGIILFIIGIIFLVFSIRKYKEIYTKRNPSSKESQIWNKYVLKN